MATTSSSTTLSAGAVDILNAIRNSASANYRDYVPAAGDYSDIREIGAIIMDYPALQNEFLNALINRIGRVILSSKQYNNPWSMFKKGTLEYGETIEEVFVELAKPFEYDPAVAEDELFKRQIPDVRAAFHVINYRKFYKTTVQRETLRQAFLSADGIANLVTKIIDSLYTGANYDEFQTMKYMLAKHIANGELYPVEVTTPISDNASSIVKSIKNTSNMFTFMSSDYNRAGVHTPIKMTSLSLSTANLKLRWTLTFWRRHLTWIRRSLPDTVFLLITLVLWIRIDWMNCSLITSGMKPLMILSLKHSIPFPLSLSIEIGS